MDKRAIISAIEEITDPQTRHAMEVLAGELLRSRELMALTKQESLGDDFKEVLERNLDNLYGS